MKYFSDILASGRKAKRAVTALAVAATTLMVTAMATSCRRSMDGDDCIKAIGECAELGTVEYSCDMRFQNTPSKFEAYKPGPRIILYSAKVCIRAGIDLSDLSKVSAETSIDGRSVTVTLPKPVILDYRIEPKDVNKEFEKIGFFRWKFTNEEKLQIRKNAEQELKDQIYGPHPRIPILQDAEKNARTEVELILKATGKYDNVIVNFKGNEEIH